jgi:hypothetical protein
MARKTYPHATAGPSALREDDSDAEMALFGPELLNTNGWDPYITPAADANNPRRRRTNVQSLTITNDYGRLPSIEFKTCQGRGDNFVRSRLQKLKQGRWIDEIFKSVTREERGSLVRSRLRLKERTIEGCLAAAAWDDMLFIGVTPAEVTSQLLGLDVLFKFEDGWALGVITRVGLRKNLWNSEITYPLYPRDDRLRDHFLDVCKYSAEEDAEAGSWVLIR